MKKIIFNNRIIAIAFFTIFSAVAAPAVMATESPVAPVEVSYIGKLQNQPLFQLKVTGDEQQNDFSVIIRDPNGNVLYSENIKAESFTKKFLLNTDEIGDDILSIEVVNKKAKNSSIYEINRNTRLVDEVEVNKVK